MGRRFTIHSVFREIKIDFLISINWIDFLISRNGIDFLISKHRFLDFEKWIFFISRNRFLLYQKIFLDIKKKLHYFCNHFVWLRITDEGSLPEMGIWSILLIKSDLKWCIHLGRSFFFYLTYFNLGGYRYPKLTVLSRSAIVV